MFYHAHYEDGLLSVFHSDKCVIESKTFNENKNETIIQFSVKDSEMYGTIVVLPYSLIYDCLHDKNLFMDIELIRRMHIDGIEVTAMSSAKGDVYASYNTSGFNVSCIVYEATIDEVVEFLENRIGE